MKCRRCNAELPDDATFCPNCGATFNPPKKKRKYTENKSEDVLAKRTKLKKIKRKEDDELEDDVAADEEEDERYVSRYEQDTSIPAMVFLAIASFLMPPVGLILFLAWINCKPKASTICCYAALFSTSILVGMVLWSIHSGVSVRETLQYTPTIDDIKSFIGSIAAKFGR